MHASVHRPQATRERLDTLTGLAKTSTDARAAQAERIDAVDRSVKQVEHSGTLRMNNLEIVTRSE